MFSGISEGVCDIDYYGQPDGVTPQRAGCVDANFHIVQPSARLEIDELMSSEPVFELATRKPCASGATAPIINFVSERPLGSHYKIHYGR
jgi:hypothetical protein